MKDKIINDILAKAIANEPLEPFEQQQLDGWLSDEGNRRLFVLWKDEGYTHEMLKDFDSIDLEKWKAVIDEKKAKRSKVVFLRKAWFQYTAAAAALIAIVGYLWLKESTPSGSKPEELKMVATTPVNDVAPGQTKAVLTLADGSKIVLDSAGTGQLAMQGTTLIRHQKGQLVYQAGASASGEIMYNTLTTANGETFTIVLPDGSEVTLNSGSSVRYPTQFTGAERKVDVSGEAFFDVSHTEGKSFIVHNAATGIDVKVFGTEFNVHTYEDEQPSITLIRGSVQVTLDKKEAGTKKQSEFIKPGQQALLTKNNQLAINDNVNLDQVLAWKKGLFYFKQTDIGIVMRQLERWYNIEVVYQGGKPSEQFGGELPRHFTLSQVIKALEQTGVHFKIEGRKLIVLP